MSSFKQAFTSSLGKKLIMSLTGLFLCTFLVVHLIGNLQLFHDDNGKAFNEYAYFMTHFPPIKVVSYLLYASIILHAIYALVVTLYNKKARPVGYAVYDGQANSKWNSRNMGFLGSILLFFIVSHMYSFWWKYHRDQVPYIEYRSDLNSGSTQTRELAAAEFSDYQIYTDNGVEVVRARDLYRQVEFAFKEWWLVAFYVIAMGSLSFHLIHGFRSAFQTLGWDHKKYVPLIRFIGIWGFGVLIPILFAAMPLYFFFCK